MTRIVLGDHEASGIRNGDLERIAHVCEVQLHEDVVQLYRSLERRIAAITVTCAHLVEPRADDWCIAIDPRHDWTSDPSAGFHDVTAAGLPYGKIKPLKKPTTRSLFDAYSLIFSHEVVEMTVRPYCDLFVQAGDSMAELEVCDPVQDLAYQIDDVLVCDFVGPAFWHPWFLPYLKGIDRRFDFLGKLSRPFEISPGGYLKRLICNQWYRDDGRTLTAVGG